MDKYYFSTEIAKLLNPPMRSKYLEREKDSLESLYSSCKKTPIGCAPVLTIPQNEDKVFGVPTMKGISAGELICPSENRIHQSVYSEVFTYKKSDHSTAQAGVKLEGFDNTGEQMKEILTSDRNSTVILPSSSMKKVNSDSEPLRCPEYKEYITSENVHETSETSKKAMRDRHLVEALWNMLKIKNHENFKDLISSFKAYKKENDKITIMDLQNMCLKLGLSAPLHVLEKLMEECDIIDKDGTISYEEFIHFLHWKNMLPENYNFKTSKYANDWKEGIINLSEDTKKIFRTTASFIGDHRYSVCSRAAGLPSNDAKDRSKLKGVAQFKEYGDASSLQPNVFTKYGISENDLDVLYSKEQIKHIFRNCGIHFSNAVFEKVWENVNNNNAACIGTIWNALKEECLLQQL